MSAWQRMVSMVRNLSGKERVERDLHDEVLAYLNQLIEEKIAAGMSPAEARRAAQIEIGGVEQVKERVRDARAGVLLEQFWQDVRYGLRTMRKRPGFTAVAVITLALGIGANVAIFSLVDAVLLRPLPYPEPDRLVMLRQSYPQKGLSFWNLSQANFAAYRDQNRVFEKLAAYSWAGYNLTGISEPARLQAATVTPEFFDVLRVQPILGRTFRTEEGTPGKSDVCILSFALWRDRFGADPNILGKALLLNNTPTEVVGVMPAWFNFPHPLIHIWVPLEVNAERRSPFLLRGIARLRPGVPPSQAEAETTGILRNVAQTDARFAGGEQPPPPGADLKTVVTPLKQSITGDLQKPLFVLLGGVGLVLLIACANVANLLLARATTRTREIALRFALGATQARVVRQLLTESLLLAGIGAAAGVTLAWWGVKLIGRLPLGEIPRLDEVQLDGTTLLFTVALTAVTGFMFGLAPSLRTRRLGLEAGLREGMRGTATASSRRSNSLLVAAQFALSLVLLVGAGLLLRSFQRLVAVDPGFQPQNVLTLRLFLPAYKYAKPPQFVQFYENLLERVGSLPGVRAAGVVARLPFTGDIELDGTVVEGHEPPPGAPVPVTRICSASADYFRTMNIPLLRGRNFLESDRAGSPPVAIVDETLARRYWPDGNAIGKRIRFAWDDSENRWMIIVGVVGGIKDNTLADPLGPFMYSPQTQAPSRRMSLVVRTDSQPAALASAIRAQIRELDPDLPAFAVATMTENIGETLQRQRLTNLLLFGFAAAALLLAAVGIYGVMALNVNGRVQEFGIRMTLGAQRGHVFRLVLAQGMRPVFLGVVVGLAAALALARFLGSLLFEVGPFDPLTYVAVVMLLAGAALAACYLPARRATRVDPMVALRYE